MLRIKLSLMLLIQFNALKFKVQLNYIKGYLINLKLMESIKYFKFFIWSHTKGVGYCQLGKIPTFSYVVIKHVHQLTIFLSLLCSVVHYLLCGDVISHTGQNTHSNSTTYWNGIGCECTWTKEETLQNSAKVKQLYNSLLII